MRFFLALLLTAGLSLAAPKTLDVHVIDVEGGKSVLIVTPAGESMLIDAGWPNANGREASTERVAADLKSLGVKQIDYMVISHFDVDHIGEIPKLATKIPIKHLVDHGKYDSTNAAGIQRYNEYAELYKTIPHIEAKAGDKIPMKGLDVLVIASGGSIINKPVKGGGAANPFCAKYQRTADIPANKEDNVSVGLLFTYGKFRMLDLADFTAYKSWELACPNNMIGEVDVYQVNVHGQAKGFAPELVSAISPRVAIMGNGARKGGDLATWPMLRGTPGLEDIWQSHFSTNGGKDNNPPDDFIANLEPSAAPNDQWKMIKMSAESNGTFTVTNGRNGFSKTYKPKK